MAKYNKPTKKAPATTTNFAGGQAFAQNNELAFISLLVTSFANNSFYEKAEAQSERMKELMSRVDPLFAAKAIVFARRKYGMRSISHLAGVSLAPSLSGKDWGRLFFKAVINRPDDMLEMTALFLSNNGKIPNAAKAGFAAAFDKFDNYQIAKYRNEGKGIKLVDLVNMVHPVPTERNETALKALIAGSLKNESTWESLLSNAGQSDDVDTSKAEAWDKLLNSGKMPYFALLRNLRNIVQQSPGLVAKACELLTNRNSIKKSLVLPFRFSTAYSEIQKLNASVETRKVLVAIAEALDISCDNIPDLQGRTLVVLDDSGSMGDKSEPTSPAAIGGLFASVLCRRLKSDLMFFSDTARYQNYNPTDSALSIFGGFKFKAGGTNFHSIFETAKQPYDRIIILSDMQGWIGYGAPTGAFNQYKSKFNCNPFVYSFDLKGYGTMQFPEEKVFCLAGFSDKVFDTMALLETDRVALVNQIKQIELTEF